jgi:hypothetical protein
MAWAQYTVPTFSAGSLGVAPQVATPTFSPAAGAYTSTQTVTISSSTVGAVICYTTDGSTPTESGHLCSGGTTSTYSTPISVATTQTVKAIGTLATYTDSAVGSAAYTISAPTPRRQYKLCGDTSIGSGCVPSASTTAYENMGTGYNGTWHGTQSGTSYWYSAGDTAPYAGNFNGSDNYITASAAGLPTGTGQPASMSLWVKWAGGATGLVAGYGGGFSYSSLGCFIDGSNILYFWGYNADLNTGITIPVGIWTNVVMTYDGTNIRTYVNGTLGYGPANPGALSLSTADGVMIGINHSTMGNYFTGEVDDVRFYDSALSAGSVAAIYAAGDQ